ncbi:hypothetical protein [Pedobacter gandavensis]|nr:hypothetical protein [Pedobacter gandavensis]
MEKASTQYYSNPDRMNQLLIGSKQHDESLKIIDENIFIDWSRS